VERGILLRLVIRIAGTYAHRGVPYPDLIQEGNLALTQAVDRYDYRRGVHFSTYAYCWVRQSLGRLVARQGSAVREPVPVVRNIRRLARATQQLEQRLGREPTEAELAGAMATTAEQARALRRLERDAGRLERELEALLRRVEALHDRPGARE
jgi:RNA polymerase sigma factor (sigma-70 family)